MFNYALKLSLALTAWPVESPGAEGWVFQMKAFQVFSSCTCQLNQMFWDVVSSTQWIQLVHTVNLQLLFS